MIAGPFQARLLRTAAAIVATLFASQLLIAGTAQADRAATQQTLTNISVTVTTTQCPQGGSVKRVNVAIDTPGTSGSSGGDTVGGLLAFYGNNNVHGSNFCQTTWYGAGYYWYWSVNRFFSFNGQHTYV